MERWWSTPMQGDKGGTVIVTGRDNLDKVIAGGKYPYLIRVQWDYNAGADGFPDEIDADLMGRINDALTAEFSKDKTAYLVAIYTGDGRRDWLFYAQNLAIFGKVFNRALADLETAPLEISAESDPEWQAYAEMRELTYIAPDDEEK